MEFKTLHKWVNNIDDAVELQQDLSVKVIFESVMQEPETICAVDTAFDADSNYLFASAVTFSYPDLKEVEAAQSKQKTDFPYIPGLLAFREGPAILDSLSGLKIIPEFILYRGHGIAHPRYFGLASHLGIWTGIPSAGCALENLAGDYVEPPREKGKWKPLFVDGNEVGSVYRSRSNVKPIFISPGHLCDTTDATNIVAVCLTSYRTPEPLRRAHLYAKKQRDRFTGKERG